MENDDVATIVYIIQDRDFDSNVDTDDILSLLAEWDRRLHGYTINVSYEKILCFQDSKP